MNSNRKKWYIFVPLFYCKIWPVIDFPKNTKKDMLFVKNKNILKIRVVILE